MRTNPVRRIVLTAFSTDDNDGFDAIGAGKTIGSEALNFFRTSREPVLSSNPPFVEDEGSKDGVPSLSAREELKVCGKENYLSVRQAGSGSRWFSCRPAERGQRARWHKGPILTYRY